MKQLILLVIILPTFAMSQYCDSLVPTFEVDLSSSTTLQWISPDTSRNGNCCGTTSPDKCVEFDLLLHPDATGIVFDIYSGAVPPGALFYQVDCGPITQVGQPLCLNGPGPHHLTFCKPGNNNNEYFIQSLGTAEFGPDVAVNDGCSDTLWTAGLNESSITWNSIYPGAVGAYNSYLNCTLGCDTIVVTGAAGFPPYVDYQVCGNLNSPCDTAAYCDTMRVYFSSSLQVNITPVDPVICYGATGITLTANPGGGTPPYNYTWSNGQTTASTYVGVGTYAVVLGDSSGCPPVSASVTVTEFTMPIEANAGPDQDICTSDLPVNFNGVIQAASGGIWSGYGGVLSPSDTSMSVTYMPSAAELANGYSDLILSSTGNAGCPGDADTVRVFYRDFDASISLMVNDITCFGLSNGSAQVGLTGGYSPHSVLWSTGDSALAISGLPAGNGAVTITNSYGCDTNVTYYVSEPTPLDMAIDYDSIKCHGGQTSNANVTITGATPGYSLTINGVGFPLPPVVNGVNLPNMNVGHYTFNAQDANGCASALNLNVSQPPDLSLALTAPDTLCFNAPHDIVSNVSGGTPGYTYNWSDGTLAANNTSPATASGYTILNVADAHGCLIEDSVYQFVQNLYNDSLTAYSSGDICIGDSVLIWSAYSGNTGPISYLWAPCGCTVPGPFYMHPTNTTLYEVTVTDQCMNTATDSVLVQVHQLPEVALPTELLSGCAPFDVSYQLDSVNPDYTYQWVIDGQNYSGSAFTGYFQTPGTFSVQLMVQSGFGCYWESDGSNYITISESPDVQIYANKTTVDMNHPVVRFTSSEPGMISYFWDFDDGTTGNLFEENHEFTQEGQYNVWHWVTNSAGCTDSAEIDITVNPVTGIYIPNAFTPDGDGINDVFRVEGAGLAEDDFSMQIFNRWGELIYESRQLSTGWDGTVNGQGEIVQTDVYVYAVQAKSVLNEVYTLKGHISLLK